MIGLLKDGWNAPNEVISDCGWGALVVTAVVVLALWSIFPALRDLSFWATVAIGGAIQGTVTFSLAGFRTRE